MKREKPWTWEEIAALQDSDLAKFRADYGDRAKVALLIAGFYGLSDSCIGWNCRDCPMSVSTAPTEWSCAVGLHIGCPDNAIPIYRLMIEELGRLPEVKSC